MNWPGPFDQLASCASSASRRWLTSKQEQAARLLLVGQVFNLPL
jgi:hypothetical protein